MKTLAVRFADAFSFEKLLQAWLRYRRGKRRRADVAAFELNQETHLVRLADQLNAGQYRHGRYRCIEIRDPKPRLIAVAAVPDRVVHMACYQALAPFFNQKLIGDSYACLPGRGSHRAVLRFREFQRQYAFFMHLDLCCYYPSVRHDILRRQLIPFLRDAAWAPFIDGLLASGAAFYLQPAVRDFFGGQTLEPDLAAYVTPRGLPIGNLTSQWWGNLYLNSFDHFVKRYLGCRGYLRYMDDFVLFADERETLQMWREAVRDWLIDRLSLRFHEQRAHIHPSDVGHTFLGYRIHGRGFRLGDKAVKRFRKRAGKLVRLGEERRIQSLTSSAGAWLF